MAGGQINLSRTDNATFGEGFKIERKQGATGSYAQTDTAGADIAANSNSSLRLFGNNYLGLSASFASLTLPKSGKRLARWWGHGI